MPHTKEEIIRMIDLDEPDYPSIVSQFDDADVLILNELVKDPNPAIAVKAVSCLGFLQHPKALEGIKRAAKDKNPVVRVAAAHSLRHKQDVPEVVAVVDKLLQDKDIGVKKFALKTVDTANIKSLKATVEKIQLAEKNEALKELSQKILQKIK